jgi:hypothetical protein
MLYNKSKRLTSLKTQDKVGYGLGTSFGVLEDLELQTVNANGVKDLSRYRTGALIFWVGCKETRQDLVAIL